MIGDEYPGGLNVWLKVLNWNQVKGEVRNYTNAMRLNLNTDLLNA